MSPADIFVGAVAACLGVWAIYSAMFNTEWCYQLRKAQWLESRLGRGGARIVFALLGLALIAMGAAIAMGFAPNSSSSQRSARFAGAIKV